MRNVPTILPGKFEEGGGWRKTTRRNEAGERRHRTPHLPKPFGKDAAKKRGISLLAANPKRNGVTAVPSNAPIVTVPTTWEGFEKRNTGVARRKEPSRIRNGPRGRQGVAAVVKLRNVPLTESRVAGATGVELLGDGPGRRRKVGAG
ncbi:hypothetical protein KM043_005353 [Ampulex compressa]|nr:hypothetical protein KM043_005353 [Ampulex compressa]